MSVAQIVARNLIITSVVEFRDQTWTKDEDGRWPDSWGRPANDREIDHKLSRGAVLVVNEIGLQREQINAYELEAGDYVILPKGWHDDKLELPDGLRDEQLWRVSGWNNYAYERWSLVLDAPEDLLIACNVDGYVEPVDMGVEPGDQIMLVTPGQNHETWEFDWDDSELFRYGLDARRE